MNKKILAAVLITTLLLLASLYIFGGAVGTQVHINGTDWAYTSGSNPAWSECYHSTQQYWQDDTEVGLGITVHMSANGYNWGWWHFDAESGGSGAYLNNIIPPLICTAGTDSGSSTYYCYNQAQWGYLPWANYQCLFTYVETSGSFSTSQYVFGETGNWFCECANPWHSWFLKAYTQPPAYDYENGYHYLTFNWADWDDCS